MRAANQEPGQLIDPRLDLTIELKSFRPLDLAGIRNPTKIIKISFKPYLYIYIHKSGFYEWTKLARIWFKMQINLQG